MAPKDIARKLVLTSHKSLYIDSFKRTLLLGKWSLKDYTVNTNSGVLIASYHWDDRDKMHSDFSYTNEVYEHILSILSVELNNIHEVTHSKRYWRILIGPWLYAFIPTLFDKWELVRLVSENYNISSVDLLDYDYERFVINEFSDIDPDDIDWVHYLLSESVKFQNKIPWNTISSAPYEHVNKGCQISKHSFFDKLGLSINNFLCRFTRRDEFFFIDTFIPRIQLIKLYVVLGIVPKIWKSPNVPDIQINRKIRESWNIVDTGQDIFIKFLLRILPFQIPKSYLEGYKNIERMSFETNWPENPVKIFTSNSFQFCEVFQVWLARKINEGSRLIIGQHGGFYGTGKWHCGEMHQVNIADKFLSWGWDDDRGNIVKGNIITNFGKRTKVWNKDGGLLFVTNPVRLYGYKSVSWPIGPNQAISFLNDQLSFIGSLSDKCRKSLTVRINKKQDEKMGSLYFDKIQESFKMLNLDDSSLSIERQIKKCRIFVYSCNSTGYLETMARGIPTVIFWDPNLFELRDEAKTHFTLLKSVGVFYENPVDAANHISENWDIIEEWWLSDKVKKAVDVFCDNYANNKDLNIKNLSSMAKMI